MTHNKTGDEEGADSRLVLASLLVARLCHELSGALGTVLTATQIAAEAAGGSESGAEALPLAADAAVQLARRLRLLRAAWGNAGAAQSVAEFRKLAEGLPGRRLRLELRDVDRAETFAAGAVQVMLNLLLLAAESLPAGGEIVLSGQPRGTMVLAIAGPHAAWPAGLAGCLVEPSEAWRQLEAAGVATVAAVRGVQAPLAALVAHRHAARVALLMGAQPHAAAPLAINLSAT